MPEKQTNKERLKDITDSIEKGIQELFQSDKYAQYLRTMSRFHRYSVNMYWRTAVFFWGILLSSDSGYMISYDVFQGMFFACITAVRQYTTPIPCRILYFFMKFSSVLYCNSYKNMLYCYQHQQILHGGFS